MLSDGKGDRVVRRQEWGGAAQLVTPITVSQRDVFSSPAEEEERGGTCCFSSSFLAIILCISYLSSLLFFSYLSLPSKSLWWKMRGCSTCCHPTLSSPCPPPTASQTTNIFFFFMSLHNINRPDGGRLWDLSSSFIYNFHLFFIFLNIFLLRFFFWDFVDASARHWK